MKQDLLEAIYTQLKSAVSTTDVYFDILPNEDLLKVFSVVYTLSLSSNENSFDSNEVLSNYTLTVKINNPTTKQIINSIVFIKSKIYDLNQINSNVKYIQDSGDDLFYDFDLKIYTGVLRFNIQYAN